MATCDELATQLSGLQSQLSGFQSNLAKLQAEQDDPEGTCAALNLTNDDCTSYMKSLGGKIRYVQTQIIDVQTQITGVQQQQKAQNCPSGTGQVTPPMISFQMVPCLDPISMKAGQDLRLLLDHAVQSKLDSLPPQPFWWMPVFDSACVSAQLFDGTTRTEERGGIWSSPSTVDHRSLPYLVDLLGNGDYKNGYGVCLDTQALQQIAAGLWATANKQPQKGVELTAYELGLAPPYQLVLTVKGTYTPSVNGATLVPVGFTATYIITLSIENNRLQIQADPHLAVDDVLYEGVIFGVVVGFLPPFSTVGAAIAQDFLSEGELEARNKVVSMADMVTVVSRLIPEQVMLPGLDAYKHAHKLVFTWSDVQVQLFVGIVIRSQDSIVGSYKVRQPSLALLTGGTDHQFPWNPNDPFSNDPQYPDYARVPLYASAIDLRTPYNTITWSVPANYADVLLIGPDTSHAIMYVPVPSGIPSPDWTYPVPLTLHIIDADGLDASMTTILTVYYNPNYTPPPPEQPPPLPSPLPE